MSWADEFVNTQLTHGDLRRLIGYTEDQCKKFTDVMVGKAKSTNKSALPFDFSEYRFLMAFHERLVENLYNFLYNRPDYDDDDDG